MKKDKIRFTYEKIKILTGCSLLAAGAILTLLAGNVGGFAQWYSTHVYPVWVNMLGRMMGVFPVSVAEILLYLLGALLLFTLGRLLWKLFRKRTGKRQVLGWFSNLLLAAGVLFLLYVVNCGINYHRTSFSESSGIKAEEYSVSELKEVCGWLTERVNTLSGSVTRDDEGIMRLTGGNKGEVRSRAVEAMQSLGETYPELSGY